MAIAYVYSVGAAITDFTIGLLPVLLIWNLRMNLRAKVAIACILGIGCMFVLYQFPLFKVHINTDLIVHVQCEFSRYRSNTVPSKLQGSRISLRNNQHFNLVQRRSRTRYHRWLPHHPQTSLPVIPRKSLGFAESWAQSGLVPLF